MQAALQALQKVGPNGCVVSYASSVWTITFSRIVGQTGGFPQLTTTYTQTGGSSGVMTPALVSGPGTTSGKFGPYDPTATDGRAVISRGNAYILDETWLYYPAGATFAGLGSPDTIGGVFEGGLIWFDRVLMATTFSGGSASLAAGPTQAQFEAAFPNVLYNIIN
jgi:hypothetical protein